jgi:hypothetical protein
VILICPLLHAFFSFFCRPFITHFPGHSQIETLTVTLDPSCDIKPLPVLLDIVCDPQHSLYSYVIFNENFDPPCDAIPISVTLDFRCGTQHEILFQFVILCDRFVTLLITISDMYIVTLSSISCDTLCYFGHSPGNVRDSLKHSVAIVLYFVTHCNICCVTNSAVVTL